MKIGRLADALLARLVPPASASAANCQFLRTICDPYFTPNKCGNQAMLVNQYWCPPNGSLRTWTGKCCP